jgi:hypothetical protein
LGEGTFVDTIRVMAPGAVDSPFELVDTLNILTPLTMAVDPTTHSHTAIVGSINLVPDTAVVTLTGEGSQTTLWEATHGGSAWLDILTPSRFGNGVLRWTRDPTGVPEGTFVDTISVSALGALGTPFSVVDTLIMISPPVGLDPTEGVYTGFIGAPEPVPDSARVITGGDGGATAQWTASVGPDSWLNLITSGGTGTGVLRWARDPGTLLQGTYVDTITVESSNGGLAHFVDTFILRPPFLSTDCAATHLMGGTCLNPTQLGYLDLAGNGDGVFNLGDFLAELARKKAGGDPGGGSSTSSSSGSGNSSGTSSGTGSGGGS